MASGTRRVGGQAVAASGRLVDARRSAEASEALRRSLRGTPHCRRLCGQVRYFWPCAALKGRHRARGQRARDQRRGCRTRHSHRLVRAREAAAVAIRTDGSAVALELAAWAQPGSTWSALLETRFGDSPRQNVHAMGVRRGVRGVYWCSPSESSLRELPELLYCVARDVSVAARRQRRVGAPWTPLLAGLAEERSRSARRREEGEEREAGGNESNLSTGYCVRTSSPAERG